MRPILGLVGINSPLLAEPDVDLRRRFDPQLIQEIAALLSVARNDRNFSFVILSAVKDPPDKTITKTKSNSQHAETCKQ